MPARDPHDIARAREFDWLVGVNIRYWREKKEFSQLEVAESANISDSQLSRIEAGERSVTLQQATQIAKTLGIRLSALWADVDGIQRETINVDGVL